MIKKIMEFLSGKKTYLLAIGAIIGALVQFSQDGNFIEMVKAIWVALVTITIRNGVSKAEIK